jgi:hypothetical protein
VSEQGSLFAGWEPPPPAVCPFCGGDASERGHWTRCDGRQGHAEADEDKARADRLPSFDVPLLVSGLHEETRDTSLRAAVSVITSKDTQRQAVYDTIVAATPAPGATDDEVQLALNIDGNSERPRRRELEMRALIAMRRDEEGKVVRRLTRTGRWAVVWVAAKEADHA